MSRLLVTGANRGLGLEFTRQLLERGDRVFAACRRPGRALPLTQLAAAHPGHLHVLPLDLANVRSIDELAREVGTLSDALDGLINNAGVLVSGERFGELGAASFADTFNINAVGPLLLTQALSGLLERGERARVVNLSSRLGSLQLCERFGTPSYAVSKAALNMVTRQLAAELGPRGVVVFSVSPGWVSTDMGGAAAPLTPQQSVRGLLEVISKADATCNGRFIDHNGATIDW